MQGIFARYGIPNLMISDNGPQFSSEEFKEFSKRYQFSHQPSSPRHPQANGLVVRTIGIVKSIPKKAKQANEDPHLDLLAYRTTGHEVTGVLPGQLLMGRRLRTTLPMIPSQLQPQLVDNNLIRHRHDLGKTQHAQYYNQRHGVSLLPELEAGEKVLLQDPKRTEWTMEGTVERKVQERSYQVTVPTEKCRRNRHDIKTVQCPLRNEATGNEPELKDAWH